jgi:hypothetical protein
LDFLDFDDASILVSAQSSSARLAFSIFEDKLTRRTGEEVHTTYYAFCRNILVCVEFEDVLYPEEFPLFARVSLDSLEIPDTSKPTITECTEEGGLAVSVRLPRMQWPSVAACRVDVHK